MASSELDWMASQNADMDSTDSTIDESTDSTIDESTDSTIDESTDSTIDESTDSTIDESTDSTIDEKLALDADCTDMTRDKFSDAIDAGLKKVPSSEIIVRTIAVERAALVDLPADADAAFGKWLAGSGLAPSRH